MCPAASPSRHPGRRTILACRGHRGSSCKKLLNRNGFNVGEPDGKVGPATREGIRKAEAKFGMPVTGRPSWNVYYALGGR
ncbi:peptidoglycan-binding domain-containing protein [Roseibium salinum]|nr:peptidoglycan-binding domain-containing protein [Roseibium salinum]